MGYEHSHTRGFERVPVRKKEKVKVKGKVRSVCSWLQKGNKKEKCPFISYGCGNSPACCLGETDY